jgi:cysteine-S-conjugate beta-lyase
MVNRTESFFDFDTPVERRNTSSLKWDRYQGTDTIPLWVADMDFKAPPEVIEALHRHVDHGIFGYTLPPDDLMEAVLNMLENAYAWQVNPEWIVWLPGLVSGLNIACRCAGEPGDEIMTTTPAYPPFLSAPSLSQRTLVSTAHEDDGSRYVFDYDAIELAVTHRTRMFILCNPHNPTGRVFTRDELSRIAEICLGSRIIICSDEIHGGLVLDQDKNHVSIATLDTAIARQTITLLSPSKTFNLPGLGCSMAVIPDNGIRTHFKKVMAGIVPHVNALGLTAALAAYRDSQDWHKALVEYLRANRDLVEEFTALTPGLSMHHTEATYLAWIDARGLEAANPATFFEDAGVGLSNGADFGTPGFVRLNFGCPRSVLTEALGRMDTAIRRRIETA